MFSRLKAVQERVNYHYLPIVMISLLCMVIGGALIIWQVYADSSYNPSVNGVCNNVDKCLEPIEEASFIARAIEPDPTQTVASHEWDFLYNGTFGSQSSYLVTTNCSGNTCQQSCGDGHNDCSIVNYVYTNPSLFTTVNEIKIKAAMRGVDSEDAPGTPQERDIGLAIAYVGSDRGSSNLGVEDVNRSGFTVVWRDVTDIIPSKTGYNLHIEKLDNTGNPIGGHSLTIPVNNEKPINEVYRYPFNADANSRYLVWVAPFYLTTGGEIISRQSFSDDPIVGVEVNTPANSAPQLTFSTPPASSAPHYVLVTEQPFSLNITASDSDGDNVSLSVIGLPAGASFTNKNGPTPQQSTFTWTPGAAARGDYNITVTTQDNFGATTQLALVLHVSSGNFAATNLFVNVAPPGAQAGLAADGAAVARVITDNLSNPNLVFSFKVTSGGTDAIQAYNIRVGQSEEDVKNGTNLKWSTGWINFSTPLTIGSRSSDLGYGGPVLAYDQDYYFAIKLKDIYGVESVLNWDYNIGHFKLRPNNYPPVLNPIPDQSVDVGNTLTVNLQATDQDIIEGVPQSLNYFVQGSLPSARMALNTGTGVFTFSPTTADLTGSPFTVTLCVRDSYTPPAQACQTTHITVNLNLIAPTGLNVSFTSPVQGTASWVHNSPGEDGFQLDRTAPAPGRDNLVSTPANTTSGGFAFNDCNGTSTVDFRLRAYAVVGAARQFSAAATASAVRPGFTAPTNLTAVRLTANSARLSWTPGASGQSGYVIYRNTTQIGTAAATDTTFDVTGLTPGTTYVLSVRPYVTISSCSPTQVLGGQATLNWMQPNPNLSFNPNTLTFTDQIINTNSAIQTIRVTNNGTLALSITSSLVGTDPGSFTIVNSVTNYSLAIGAYWDAQIRFRPTTVGAKTAQFKVTDAANGVDVSGNLQGTGVPAPANSVTANWSDPNRLNVNWIYTAEPDGWQINLTNYSNNPVEEEGGNIMGSSFNIANCYSVTGTTHTVSLRAYSGTPRVYSTSVSTNAGERPGWELPSPDPTFTWLTTDSVRMTWVDPTTAGSQYEVLVFEGTTRRFNGTTTADAASFDITGLTQGVTYTVKMRSFRILPSCGSTIIWGMTKVLSYINPLIEIQSFIQDFSRPTSSINLRGIPLGFLAHVPIKLKNNGNVPLTINYLQLQTSEGITLDDPLPTPPAPWNPGTEWTLTIGTSPIATTTPENNIITDLVLGTSSYGEVKRLPIRMYGLVDDPARTLQVFTTSGYWWGNFGGQAGGNNKCNTDASSERDPNKRYKALLWINNSTSPGVLINNGIYRKANGSFMFGTEDISVELPIIAQANFSMPAWTGRIVGLESDLSIDDCADWTGGVGTPGKYSYANSFTRWSSANSYSISCASSNRLICVEVQPVNGDYIVVSQNTHNGNFASDSGLGGATWYEKANDFCQVDSNTNDNYEWRALLYAGSDNPLPQSVIIGARNYYNTNDQLLFTAAADNSVPTTLSTVVSTTENIMSTGFDSGGWGYCSVGGGGPWSNAASVSGNHITMARSNANNWLFHGSVSCNYLNHLYCVRQSMPVKRIVVSDVAPNNGAFMSAAIPGSNWWEKANYICQNSSRTGGTGIWRALLWADNTLPQTVIHANTLYIRSDGHRIFKANYDNEILTNLFYAAATSSVPATGYGDPSRDCNNWTSIGSQVVRGDSNYTDNRWLNNGVLNYNCNSNVYFYCVEQ